MTIAILHQKFEQVIKTTQNVPKTDDNQLFWVHFEWFLALFHISDEKWLLS